MAKDKHTEPFEALYARLEESVAKLEAGGLPLEQSIALYEEGMTLARQCQERLDEAELKITKLRETFAQLPPRATNGAMLNDADDGDDATDDVEYVAADDEPPMDDDPFA